MFESLRPITIASRYQDVECGYCGAVVLSDVDAPVPSIDDDAAWLDLTNEHNDDCEWTATRAHRVEVTA